MAALGLADATVERLGIYPAILQLVRDKGLTSKHITVGFVVELSQLVVTKPRGGKKLEVPADRISVTEFCHIVAYMKGRWGVEVVTMDIQKNLWNMVDERDDDMVEEREVGVVEESEGFELGEGERGLVEEEREYG